MKTIIVDEELKYLDQLECILGEYGEIELLGAFGKDQIVGKLVFRVWPLKKLGPVH